MDVSVSGGAGGGMFGQVPVGMAGGSPGGGAMPGFDSAMSKLTKQAGVKPTIDSLPDKVQQKKYKKHFYPLQLTCKMTCNQFVASEPPKYW